MDDSDYREQVKRLTSKQLTDADMAVLPSLAPLEKEGVQKKLQMVDDKVVTSDHLASLFARPLFEYVPLRKAKALTTFWATCIFSTVNFISAFLVFSAAL